MRVSEVKWLMPLFESLHVTERAPVCRDVEDPASYVTGNFTETWVSTSKIVVISHVR